MNYSKNYGLKLPESDDYYNVEDFNENAEAIDTALADKLSKRVGGTVAGAVRLEGDVTAVGENGIYAQKIKGYSGLEISGDYIGIKSADSSGKAGNVDISGNVNIGGGTVSVTNDLSTHKVLPEETDTYTVGQEDLRYAEGHFGTVYTDDLNLSEPLSTANGGTGA
ncbi:MAG: hypothetical protein LUG66_10375, partial [Clostridiales bacterium]|nr:hypothetical protein [Clostridiales bacterium]